MILHTFRTISIGDFSEMLTFDDLTKLKRLPVKVSENRLKKAYSDILNDYNININKDSVKKGLNKNFSKLRNLIDINVKYKMMFDLLGVYMSFKTSFEALESTYEIIEDKELINDINNFKRISEDAYKKIEKLYYEVEKAKLNKKYIHKLYDKLDLKIKKYKQNYADEEEPQKFDFEKLVTNIESILAPLDVRSKKLYIIEKYIELANKKVKNGRN